MQGAVTHVGLGDPSVVGRARTHSSHLETLGTAFLVNKQVTSRPGMQKREDGTGQDKAASLGEGPVAPVRSACHERTGQKRGQIKSFTHMTEETGGRSLCCPTSGIPSPAPILLHTLHARPLGKHPGCGVHSCRISSVLYPFWGESRLIWGAPPH